MGVCLEENYLLPSVVNVTMNEDNSRDNVCVSIELGRERKLSLLDDFRMLLSTENFEHVFFDGIEGCGSKQHGNVHGALFQSGLSLGELNCPSRLHGSAYCADPDWSRNRFRILLLHSFEFAFASEEAF